MPVCVGVGVITVTLVLVVEVLVLVKSYARGSAGLDIAVVLRPIYVRLARSAGGKLSRTHIDKILGASPGARCRRMRQAS